MKGLEILPVEGMGEIGPGTRLAEAIAARAELAGGDVVVVTQKIVSKAEGRLERLDPADRAARVDLVERESVRVLRRRGELIVSETTHGFICANAGIDESNVAEGWVTLLPADPDRSARRIRDGLRAFCSVEVGVIVSDTFGRPWRHGLVDVAIGCAGIAAVVDLRGTTDAGGRTLSVTEMALADQLAAAAGMVMGKAASVPVAIVRGVDRTWFRDSSVRSEIVRHTSEDLFR